MHRIVVKIGTQVITRDNGLLNEPVLRSITGQIAELKRRKSEVILVSSGAMAAGRWVMKDTKWPDAIVERQILASVGQIRLMEVYRKLFEHEGYHVAQVLATKEDFRDRHHYLSMKGCFTSLLHDDIVPIVNENDVVAINELMFTDNDELAGLIAGMMNVEDVVLMTSVDGLYDRHPDHGDAKLLEKVDSATFRAEQHTCPTSTSTFGRGGMHTKCRVACKLSKLGITTHIINGRKKGAILDVVAGKAVGTTFIAKKRASGIKKWIAHTEGQEKGVVYINECAEELLFANDKARSLLPVGITKVEGSFAKGDIIKIQNGRGQALGCGVAKYGSDIAQKNIGKKNKKPLIHYDYLFLNG